MTTAMIVWNGCDSYVEAHLAIHRGYDFDGYNLFHGGHKYTPFHAVQIDPAAIPKDDEGEPIMDGVLGTETGAFYRAV